MYDSLLSSAWITTHFTRTRSMPRPPSMDDVLYMECCWTGTYISTNSTTVQCYVVGRWSSELENVIQRGGGGVQSVIMTSDSFFDFWFFLLHVFAGMIIIMFWQRVLFFLMWKYQKVSHFTVLMADIYYPSNWAKMGYILYSNVFNIVY